MISRLGLFLLLLGTLPLITGCGLCVCKEKKCAPVQTASKQTAQVIKKELAFSSVPQKKASPRREVVVVEKSVEKPIVVTDEPTKPVAASTEKVFLNELKNEEAFYKATKNPTVVYFTAKWCNHCNKIDPIFKAVATELGTKYTFITIDADKFRTLATDMYRINAVPVILFFNDGQEIASVPRLVSSDTTKEMLLQAIEKAFN